MNKLFIGLLIVAAGTGAFFLLRKKNKPEPIAFNKELIVGKWKVNSLEPGTDSSFRIYRYEFLESGNILRSLNDSVKADTAYYEWNKEQELIWKEKQADKAGNVFAVLTLNADSLQLQSKDSSVLLFTRLK